MEIIGYNYVITYEGNMKFRAFTLAETLITLGILGIVSALTLPSVITRYQKNVTTSKLKKIYSIFYNAYNRAEQDFGSSDNWNYPQNTENFTIHDFWNTYLSPYIQTEEFDRSYIATNINGIDAGFIGNSIAMGVKVKMPDGSCAFIWNNNQFLGLAVDINCQRKPNVVGKDIFDIAELYWAGKSFKTTYVPKNEERRKIYINECKNTNYVSGSPSRCFGVFVYDGWTFKKDYPW
mgnify:CR=1 FL=1